VTWDRSAIVAAAPVAAVAVIAGVVSFAHIEGLALSVHQTITTARLLPFSVDFLIVAGSVILLCGSPLGWIGVVPGVAATIYANVMSGLPHGPLSATVAGWPAAAFVLATAMLERWLKAHAKPSAASARECGHALADTPERAVVLAYLHGRDCLGEPPSQRQLAAVWNVSRPKVAELVGTLNGQHPQGAGDESPAD
jgi:Protein of unknown function (DUF2637)